MGAQEEPEQTKLHLLPAPISAWHTVHASLPGNSHGLGAQGVEELYQEGLEAASREAPKSPQWDQSHGEGQGHQRDPLQSTAWPRGGYMHMVTSSDPGHQLLLSSGGKPALLNPFPNPWQCLEEADCTKPPGDAKTHLRQQLCRGRVTADGISHSHRGTSAALQPWHVCTVEPK